ncbi:phosphohistidine phosphatase SixA [Oceanidesulfovibrio indonesiensis]|jgi:phosphohistidine phosphatase|nr:phosphohistidine phosphatase SixA [Oceanidesulfovibrio indonesiensis]
MHIYLMQHGAAFPKEVDPEQPLSPVGAEQVESSAKAMKSLGIKPEVIIASPKKRSRQTAARVAAALGVPESDIMVSEAVKATANSYVTLEFLAGLPRVESVLIAGHLPNLERLAALFVAADGKASIAFQNGGLTCIDAPRLENGQGTLLFHITPKHLRAIAGA